MVAKFQFTSTSLRPWSRIGLTLKLINFYAIASYLNWVEIHHGRWDLQNTTIVTNRQVLSIICTKSEFLWQEQNEKQLWTYSQYGSRSWQVHFMLCWYNVNSRKLSPWLSNLIKLNEFLWNFCEMSLLAMHYQITGPYFYQNTTIIQRIHTCKCTKLWVSEILYHKIMIIINMIKSGIGKNELNQHNQYTCWHIFPSWFCSYSKHVDSNKPQLPFFGRMVQFLIDTSSWKSKHMHWRGSLTINRKNFRPHVADNAAS